MAVPATSGGSKYSEQRINVDRKVLVSISGWAWSSSQAARTALWKKDRALQGGTQWKHDYMLHSSEDRKYTDALFSLAFQRSFFFFFGNW